MSKENWKINLKAAAELIERSENDILEMAKTGDIHLCIRAPEDVVVFSSYYDIEGYERPPLLQKLMPNGNGPYPEKIANISYLVLFLQDSKKLCIEGSVSTDKFSSGYAWSYREEIHSVSLNEIRPSCLLHALKLYSSNSTANHPSEISRGKSVSKLITIDDIYFIRSEIEKFKLNDIPDQSKYGDYRPQPYTSKKLAILNEASTYAYGGNGLKDGYLKPKVEAWLQKKGFSETLAKRSAHFINKGHNPRRGKGDNPIAEKINKTHIHIDEFKPNEYTSNSLALINKAAMFLNENEMSEEDLRDWLKDKCGFGVSEINLILLIIKK